MSYLRELGFAPQRSFIEAGGIGLLGTGCDEYTFTNTGAVPKVSARLAV
jgi:hypothetical protein